MSLSDIQWEFLKDVSKLIQFAELNDYKLTAGEFYRTPEQQAIYLKSGRSKTMNSKHLKRLAVDFNIFFNNQLVNSFDLAKPLGDFWESLNPKNKWGGNFRNFVDIPHFERSE